MEVSIGQYTLSPFQIRICFYLGIILAVYICKEYIIPIAITYTRECIYPTDKMYRTLNGDLVDVLGEPYSNSNGDSENLYQYLIVEKDGFLQKIKKRRNAGKIVYSL